MKLNLLLNVLNVILKMIYSQYLKDTGSQDGDIQVTTVVDTHVKSKKNECVS